MPASPLFREGPLGRMLVLDPRTKLLLVTTAAVVLLMGNYGGIMDAVRIILGIMPFVLIASSRRYEAAAIYLAFFSLVYITEWVVSPFLSGIPHMIVLVVCAIMARFVPSIAIGYFVLTTTTVSELVAALERMHVPQSLVIPISVMFRFIPTVAEESAAIGDAMKMRGVRIGGKRSAEMLEFRFVPLLMSSVKIGEELSAAALTKGLGAPVRRSNVCVIGFHAQDVAIIAICAFCFLCFFANCMGLI